MSSVPMSQVALVGSILFGNMCCSVMLMPMAPFIVGELLPGSFAVHTPLFSCAVPGTAPEDLGYSVGLLSSIYQLGSFFGSIFW